MAKKPQRRFIKERRQIACPSCLDRNALTIEGHKVYERREVRPCKCQVCDGKGFIHEEYPVGNEWRRYPWVIAK
jgi:hypothetical protein